MDAVAAGPLPVASLVWQPRPGAWVLTVVAKVTYMLRPGEAVFAPRQEHPVDDERFVDEDPARGLRCARDLVPVKPSAEVILVGSAHAPERRPIRSLVARLVVGELDKAIEVVGDRSAGPDGAISEPRPFTSMPLTYDRAAGGPGTSNPIGIPRGARDAAGRVRLPNLQRPGSQPQAIEATGFGPISPTWPERRDRLKEATWSFRDLAGKPLPEGMDLGYFNSAPRDQLLRGLGDSERIVLENLHPEFPRLTTTLLGVAPRATVEGRKTGPAPVPMRADTLWIDTDRGVCTLTFRGLLPLEAPDEAGRVVVAIDRGRVPESSGIMRAPSPVLAEAMTADISTVFRQAQAATPFAPAPGAPRAAPPPVVLELPRAAPVPAPSPWAASPPVAAGPPPSSARPVVAPSAFEASNAARSDNLAPARVEAPPSRPAPAPESRSSPRIEARETVELLWLDLESVSRMRRKPAWRPILEAAEKSRHDDEQDDAEGTRDPLVIEDRREGFEILGRADALDWAGFEEAFARCQRDDGKLVPGIEVLAGDLETPFDEIASLRATVATVTPLVGTDDGLRATVATANEVLDLRDGLVAPAVAEALTKRIEEAFAAGKRAVQAGYIEAQRDRVLLEQRKYQRRTVFGAAYLRTLLRIDPESGGTRKSGNGQVVAAYLPARVAELLPLTARFRARAVAELRASPDPNESHHAAIRVLAVARVSAPARR